VLDAFARHLNIQSSREKFHAVMATCDVDQHPVVLLKPQTFMNRSGRSVAKALTFFKMPASQCVVLHDDLDLDLGVVKVKIGGGHGGHNGLRSIIDEVGHADFIRVRLGIGRPPHGDTVDWVLGAFSADEGILFDHVFNTGVLALQTLLKQGPTAAMNAVNGLRPPA